MLLDQLFSIIGIIVYVPLVIFIFRHYFKTQYRASFILGLHFLAILGIHLCFAPVPWIKDLNIAQNLLKGDVLISMALPALAVAFFETTMNRSSKKILILFMAYYTFLLGIAFSPIWDFIFNDFWFISFAPTTVILFALPFAAVAIYIFIRLAQIIRFNQRAQKLGDVTRNWKVQSLFIVVWTFCLLGRYLALLLITINGIDWFTEIIFLLTIFTVALIYLYDPSIFFISNAKIQLITFFDATSGLTFYAFGSSLGSIDLKVSGLHGADTLLKEIAGASSHPSLLRFIDRVVMLEYQKVENTSIAAAIIATEYNPALVPSLRKALNSFGKKYYAILKDWNNDQNVFTDFTPDLFNIFDYAYPKRFKLQNLMNEQTR